MRCSPRQLHCTGGLRLDQIRRLSTTLVVNT
ncbi:pyridoxamine 5'-phosphate oxidase, partial [Streptomyces albidoflavus]